MGRPMPPWILPPSTRAVSAAATAGVTTASASSASGIPAASAGVTTASGISASGVPATATAGITTACASAAAGVPASATAATSAGVPTSASASPPVSPPPPPPPPPSATTAVAGVSAADDEAYGSAGHSRAASASAASVPATSAATGVATAPAFPSAATGVHLHRRHRRLRLRPPIATTSSSGRAHRRVGSQQIGLTQAIETQANGGNGVTIGLVDTGVANDNPEVVGRVSSASSCAAVTFTCSNGYYDDNGHGTATASIAAGQFNSNDLMAGVAPAATVLSEKVLNASGSGYDTDVANGITKAANAGASVISLSLTYLPTPTVVSAINYATGLGAVIVWAGGNSSAALNGGANTTGLNATALSRLIIVGSVDSNNVLSYFSNTPGSASLSTGSASETYASVWLMAPGENIIAPAIQHGKVGYGYWSGTSMSTPEVAGAIALLEATWPILKTNGTAAAVLLSSATDLGAAGVDSTYGQGLLNITKAFAPVGTMSVVTTGGGIMAVANAGGVAVSSAFGTIPAIQSVLSHYTAFDSFERNFTLNLSGMLTPRSVLPQAVAAHASPIALARTVLPNGGRLSVASSALSDYDLANVAPALRLSTPASPAPENSAFYFSMSGKSGSLVSVGRGVPSTAAFASALWGERGITAYQADSLGVSNALTSMAEGGLFAAAGANLTSRLRIAGLWTATPQTSVWSLTPTNDLSEASAVAVGLSYRASEHSSVGLTFSALSEKNGLLGSTYDARRNLEPRPRTSQQFGRHFLDLRLRRKPPVAAGRDDRQDQRRGHAERPYRLADPDGGAGVRRLVHPGRRLPRRRPAEPVDRQAAEGDQRLGPDPDHHGGRERPAGLEPGHRQPAAQRRRDRLRRRLQPDDGRRGAADQRGGVRIRRLQRPRLQRRDGAGLVQEELLSPSAH